MRNLRVSETKRLLALAVLPTMLLAGCGGDDKASSKSSSSSSTTKSSSSSSSTLKKAVTNGKISDVKLDTKDPKNPKVTIDKSKLPFGTKKLEEKVIKEGDGAKLTDADLASIDYIMVNGTSGKTLASSFGQEVSRVDMSQSNQLLPGFVSTLKKHKIGSQVLVSLPASEAFGSAGNTSAGVNPNDNIVLYLDMKSSEKNQLDCSTSPSDSSLPKVEGGDQAKTAAKLTFPKGGKAPQKLTCAKLASGKGQTVKKGDTISVIYTGQVWNGKVFDSSAKNGGKAASFQIGAGQVIPGWDRTLVGRKVGDRVLIVIPPKDGYGSQGNSQAGIKGTDTLAFVAQIQGIQ